jgi:hypothetical protein
MVIGVSGKKRSGKDTFFEIIKKSLSGRHFVKKYAFADKVKKYAIKYFNVNPIEIKKEENRFLLQGIGQVFRQEVDKDFWVNSVFSDMYASRLKNPNEISIITDVRYQNEAEKILSLESGILVRVENPNTQILDYHESENELNNYPFDVKIYNDSSIEDYERKVEKWAKENLQLLTNLL